jgi:hypothetical protein
MSPVLTPSNTHAVPIGEWNGVRASESIDFTVRSSFTIEERAELDQFFRQMGNEIQSITDVIQSIRSQIVESRKK